MSEKKPPSSVRKTLAITTAAITAGLGIGAKGALSNPDDGQHMQRPTIPEQQAPDTVGAGQPPNLSEQLHTTTTTPGDTLPPDTDRQYDNLTPPPGPLHTTIPDEKH